jgi:dipeptidyl aminopeptidase/acylaminoacyl peptidase
MTKRCLAGMLLSISVARGVEPAAVGPWDLEDLRKPPKVTWVDKEGTLRQLYYESEPYKGKATRVFAYYAQPEKVDGKLPAMVLVHGGGGKAFAEWAQLWAKRGYVALAMDLAGHGPDGARRADGGPEQACRCCAACPRWTASASASPASAGAAT